MHDNLVQISESEILNLNLNDISQESKIEFVSRLLKGLHDKVSSDNDIISKNDINNSSDLIKTIINNIDWEILNNSEYGQDKFFNGTVGLYTSLKNKIENLTQKNDDFKPINYSDLADYWNESIAELMALLAKVINPEQRNNYENSGLLIETIDPDGKIDTNHLRGALKADGSTVTLRIIDIINADAGASFNKQSELYDYKTLIEKGKFIFTAGSEKTVVPFENICFNKEADNWLEQISVGIKNYTKSKLNQYLQSSYCYRGTINLDDVPDNFDIKLDITQSVIFKIVAGPWVIPWYNIDEETYRHVRGDDKKLSVLANDKRLDFTREKDNNYIRLLMPQYKRKVEVEDLNRNFWVIAQVLTGISVYLFDPNGPLVKMFKGLLIEIAQIWENTTYLWAALDLLSQKRYYNKTHSEVLILSYNELYPYLKYDNFDQIEMNNKIEEILTEMVNMYPNYNLAILPIIRNDNYEKNFFSKIIIPGVWVYNRNNENPSWTKISFNINGTIDNLIIDLADYQEKIYGLREDEESYNYIAPLSAVEDLSFDSEQRYYGLLRDNIVFNADITEEIKTINVSIELIDLAKKLITNENKIIYKCSGAYSDSTIPINNIIVSSNILEISDGQTKITQGYYQGELLSSYLDSRRIVYNIYPLPTAELKPTAALPSEVNKFYSTSSAYKSMRDSDKETLTKIIENFVAYNSLDDIDHSKFWESRINSFDNGEHFYGKVNGVDQATTRNLVPFARWDQSKLYYGNDNINQDNWKKENNEYYIKTDGTDLDKYTILIVEGSRQCNYIESKQHSDEGQTTTYFPSDGLTAPIWSKTAPGFNFTQTGAVLAMPLKDGSRKYSFYNNHGGFSNYAPVEYHAQPTVFTEHRGLEGTFFPLKDEEGGEGKYVKQAVAKNKLLTDLYAEGLYSSGMGSDQWIVMLKDGDTEVTPDNWLVVRVTESWMYGAYLLENYLSDELVRTHAELYLSVIESYNKTQYHCMVIRNIAASIIQQIKDGGNENLTGICLVDLYNAVINKITNSTNTVCQEIVQSNYDEEWYLTQCILYGRYDPQFLQQCKMLKRGVSGGGWSKSQVKQLLERHNVTPTEFGGGFTFPIPNESESDLSEEYTVNGDYFIDGQLRTQIGVFVFGPNGLYSRRLYVRGKNYHFDEHYDEQTKKGNVDQLRKGYRVISNTNQSVNLEKYKSKGKLLIADEQDSTKYGAYNPIMDDNGFTDYNIKWEDDLQAWDTPS